MRGIYIDFKRRFVLSAHVDRLLGKSKLRFLKKGVSLNQNKNFLQVLDAYLLERLGYGKIVFELEKDWDKISELVFRGSTHLDGSYRKRKVVIYIKVDYKEYPISIGEIINDRLILY